MTQLNSLNLIGRLTRDPEKTYINSGKALTKFDIAVSLGFGDKEKTGFFSVTTWDKTAEFVAQYFTKGKEILVEGSLDFQQWEKDGEKRSKVCINAFKCGFVGAREDAGEPQRTNNGSQEVATGDNSKSDDVPF